MSSNVTTKSKENNTQTQLLSLTSNNNDQAASSLETIRKASELEYAITPRFKRYVILLATLTENLIFSGIIFGWPALFYMLKNEKIYSELCFNNTMVNANGTAQWTGKLDCSKQENKLNMAFTTGVFIMGFSSFVWGFLLEHFGLRFVRIVLNVLISLGCALLCMTTHSQPDLIIFAVIILGLIGVPLRIANMQIADYFPKRRSTVITVFSGAFSASPVVFVLLKYCYDNLGLSYLHVMAILFAVSILMAPVTFFLLPSHSVLESEHKLLTRWEELQQLSQMDKRSIGKAQFITKKELIDLIHLNGTMEVNINGDGDTLEPEPDVVELQPVAQLSAWQSMKAKLMVFVRGKGDQDHVPLRVSLLSASFLAHQLWFSWLNTYMVLYSGSLTLWLGRVTDDQRTTRTFTQAFGLVQVSALLFAPMAGFIMDASVRKAMQLSNFMQRKLRLARSGFMPILITTVMLSCAVLSRFFDQPLAVYVSILFITLLRSFLIAVASAYIRVRFPASHFNRLNGIMCTTGAFFSLLQYPLFYYESRGGVYAFYVNLFCAIMTMVSMINPVLLGWTRFQNKLLLNEQAYEKKLQVEGNGVA